MNINKFKSICFSLCLAGVCFTQTPKQMDYLDRLDYKNIATAVTEAEDNGPENGYSMYCETKEGRKLWVNLDEVHKGDTFKFQKIPGTNEAKVIKILEHK